MRITCAVITLILALCAPLLSAEKTSLAVMDFVARDVPKEDVAKISILIRNELSNLSQYRTLDREQLVKALGAGIECDDVACAVEAGKKLGVRTVIVGVVMKFGENVTVTGSVIDAASGTVLMAEKERAVFQADEYYMIERFCDRLSRRLTGQALYRDDRPCEGGSASATPVMTYSAPEYRAAADPTAWLALGFGIASGIGFLEAAASFDVKKKGYRIDRSFYMSLWQLGADPMFPDPQLQMMSFLSYVNIKNDLAHARRLRNTEYFIATGVGGFAALMLTTLIGRSIYHAVHDGKETAKGSLHIEISSRFADRVPEDVRTPYGIGVGLAMRF